MRCKHNLGGVGRLRIEPHGAFQKNSGLIFFTCHVFGEDVGVQKSFLVLHICSNGRIYTGCSRIYDPILKLYKQQTGKDSTKAIIFSERS